MSIPSTRTHMDGLIAALEAAGLTVGDGESSTTTTPYCWTAWVGGGLLDGPVGDPDDDGELVAQVTYVGSGREQADLLRDSGRAALLGRGTVTVTGRTVWRVSLDVAQPSQRDDSVQPPVFFAVDRYRLHTTPA